MGKLKRKEIVSLIGFEEKKEVLKNVLNGLHNF